MPCLEVWSPIEPVAFPKLKRLRIEDCPKLRRGLPSHLPALEKLSIIKSSCDSLTSLPLETFPNLKYLIIQNCENLESLSASPECALQNLSSLAIRRCPNFVSFPREGLHAPSMIDFRVCDCDKLKSLPQQMNSLLPKLDYLAIENCPEIESFPEGGMPPSLRSIYIANCEKLLSDPALPSMDMLTTVCIEGPGDGMKSFPKEGLLPSSLTSLSLYGFSSLETLDCKGLLHLTSLQRLRIARCPKLENIAGERLPASLTELDIFASPLLNELHRRVFDGIRVYSIRGPCDGIKSFPKEGLLPSSLTSLRLKGFSSLETLDCKGLLHLTSLQSLTIYDCPKLENIAGERLPASLTELHIDSCPLLKERCFQKHPQVWPKISHVHDIEVDFVTCC